MMMMVVVMRMVVVVVMRMVNGRVGVMVRVVLMMLVWSRRWRRRQA